MDERNVKTPGLQINRNVGRRVIVEHAGERLVIG